MKPEEIADEAEIRNEMRQMYRDLGYAEMMVALKEMVMAVRIAIEVIAEELAEEYKNK